jgi:hypothetical protein
MPHGTQARNRARDRHEYFGGGKENSDSGPSRWRALALVGGPPGERARRCAKKAIVEYLVQAKHPGAGLRPNATLSREEPWAGNKQGKTFGRSL